MKVTNTKKLISFHLILILFESFIFLLIKISQPKDKVQKMAF